MVVYVVTGASRGLGYEFVCQLSRNADNIVFGLARNKEATEKKVATDGLKNVHIVSADINDHKSLQAAKADIEKQTSVVDVLINNAAYMNPKTQFVGLTDFEKDPDVLYDDLMVNFQTNVIGVVKVTNTFLPMIRKSKVRKVITISTGLADDTFTNGYNIFEAAPYSISKAALNTVVAKYNAQHGKSSDGILFLAISPGLVDTGSDGVPPPDSEMPMKFGKAYPHFTGPMTPEDSVKAVMSVVNRADASNEFAGAFVSHFGNKKWL